MLFLAFIAAAGTAPASLPADALAPKMVVSLTQALEKAFARNVSALVAHAEVRRVEGLLKEARSLSLPTLYVNGVYTRLDNDRLLNGQVILGANQFSANAALTVPLILPYRWTLWMQAHDQWEIAKLSESDQRRIVALAVGRAYLTIMVQKRVLEVSARAVETGKLQVEFADQRYRGGLGNKIDRLRAEQELALAEQQQTNAYVSLARACESLGILIGEKEPVDAQGDDAPREDADLAASLESAKARADLALALRRQRAQHRATHQSWTEYMPSVSGTFQPFFQDPPSLTQPRWGWQAQVLLTLPLFDGGARYGRTEQRRAMEEQAHAQLEQLQRQSDSEVRVAYEAVRRADIALAAAQKSASLAGEARALANVAYKSGAATSLEVIDAERRARDADTQAALAEDTARQARLELLAASGKFP